MNYNTFLQKFINNYISNYNLVIQDFINTPNINIILFNLINETHIITGIPYKNIIIPILSFINNTNHNNKTFFNIPQIIKTYNEIINTSKNLYSISNNNNTLIIDSSESIIALFYDIHLTYMNDNIHNIILNENIISNDIKFINPHITKLLIIDVIKPFFNFNIDDTTYNVSFGNISKYYNPLNINGTYE